MTFAKPFLFSAIAVALCVTPALAKPTAAQEKLLALLRRSPASLEPLITVRGDELDPRITVSSMDVSVAEQKVLFATYKNENSFLRAYIDKKTGETKAEIYHIARYGGDGWNHFRRATFSYKGQLTETAVESVGTDVDCYRSGCYHTEELVFPVDLAILEEAAGRFDPANPIIGLKYRLFAQSGSTLDELMPGNEIVAFVTVINRLRAKKS